MTEIIWLILCFSLSFAANKRSFNHNVEYEHESGEYLKLLSKGKFADIIDLDDYQGIKRLLCKNGLIMIALKDDYTHPKWKAGQIVLGSSKWFCQLASNGSSPGGIYTRIKQIVLPKDNRIDLLTENVGPFDILEEAEIHLRYTTMVQEKANETGTRRKRSVSNMLTDTLNNVNWHANATLQIPYNYNQTANEQLKKFSLHRYNGLKNLVFWPMEGDEQNDTGLRDSTFVWSCSSCYGVTKIDYTFDLVIWKDNNNKPIIKRYISQIEAETKYTANYKMKFKEEKAFNAARLLWHTPTRELLRVQLAKVNQLPPVELVISSNDVVFAQIHGAVSGPTNITSNLDTSGKYVFSQKFMPKSSDHGDATTFDWAVKSNSFDINSTGRVNVSASLIQTILFNASVTWTGKDVSASLSPPALITITPKVSVVSDTREFSKCYKQNVDIKGDFQFDRAKFLVQAFGLRIWNVLLSSGYHKKFRILTKNTTTLCSASCAGPDELSLNNLTLEISKDKNGSIQYLYGNEVHFALSSGSIENGTVCSNGSIRDNRCASRLMSSKMALLLARLVQLAAAEWPNDKLIVLESFVQETSGKYGKQSAHYFGKAANITTSSLVTSSERNQQKARILSRLAQLAICSGFSWVKKNLNRFYIHVGLTDNSMEEDAETRLTKQVFQSALHKAATFSLKENPLCSKRFPSRLTLGQTYPPGKSEFSTCGPPMFEIQRISPDIENRLFHYKYDDVTFDPESSISRWCGLRSRKCNDCKNGTASDPWNWCSNRMMTHRLAIRLRKLASLSKQETMNIQVLTAYFEDKEDVENSQDLSPLFREGRAARIAIVPRASSDLGRLAALAVCAGFDFVSFTNNTYIDVFVKPQEQYAARIISYPNGDIRTSVPVRKLDDKEYLPHERHENESRIPILLDGYNMEQYLSEKYKISDILSPGSRYFRFDPVLLQCLELASEDLGRRIDVIPGSGYRTRSLNLNNIDDRSTEEAFRFQMGQAVEVHLSGEKRERGLVDIGKSIIRTCPDVTRELQLVIGIGCYKDRLYVDIRPTTMQNEGRFIKLWDSGGSAVYLALLPYVFSAVTGGAIISPFDKSVACSAPIVDDTHRYLSMQLGQPSGCLEVHQKEFCSQTAKHREEEANLLQERLSSAAGSNKLPRRDIIEQIRACVVGPCGGCTGSGSTWDVKVKSCSSMIQQYINRASRSFHNLHNRAAFFNTENLESTVHSLACHLGSMCVENIQLYSLLMPLVTARYRPESDKSVEERLFTAEDNPTPLLELVSQEMAIRASGVVKVYIDSDKDMSMLRNVLKVLMVYNKNVTKVEFHVTDNIEKDMVRFSIQRKIEAWSITTCSDWSRFAVTPYSVHSISYHRRKRSARRSLARNIAKINLHDWEYDWLSKM